MWAQAECFESVFIADHDSLSPVSVNDSTSGFAFLGVAQSEGDLSLCASVSRTWRSQQLRAPFLTVTRPFYSIPPPPILTPAVSPPHCPAHHFLLNTLDFPPTPTYWKGGATTET